MPEDKVASLSEAVSDFVSDGALVYIGGFSHAIGFAAAHEIVRGGFRDLVLARATPDLVYDQMVAAGSAAKIIFSWAGNPGLGMLSCIRRAVESGDLEVEEYTHHAIMARLYAGATGLPFYPLPAGTGGDLARVNSAIRSVSCPYTSAELATVPALRPDVTFVQAHRGDRQGNVQLRGISGDLREAAFAAEHVVACVEELVDNEVIRAEPSLTLIPAMIVDAVVHEPWGAHPSYIDGRYERDDAFYREWTQISRDPRRVDQYLEQWVYGVEDRREYAQLLAERLDELAVHRQVSAMEAP